MGCFDFIFADNGSNIRGSHGYLYLTNEFAELTKLPNPLSFSYINKYGILSVELPIKGKEKIKTELDVYAIYTTMVHLADEIKEEFISSIFKDQVEKFISNIRNREFGAPMETVMGAIRFAGIEYFFSNVDTIRPKKNRDNSKTIR